MILTQGGGKHIVLGNDKVEFGKSGVKDPKVMNLLDSSVLSGCLAILFVLDFGAIAAAQTAEQLLQSIPGGSNQQRQSRQSKKGMRRCRRGT
jgi:hypothetical protein